MVTSAQLRAARALRGRHTVRTFRMRCSSPSEGFYAALREAAKT